MPNRKVIGTFEGLILSIVNSLYESHRYGVPIWLEAESAKPTSIGAVYTTLARLEAKGLVKSKYGKATPVRGGRAKKFFEITKSGTKALNEYREYADKIRDFGCQSHTVRRASL